MCLIANKNWLIIACIITFLIFTISRIHLFLFFIIKYFRFDWTNSLYSTGIVLGITGISKMDRSPTNVVKGISNETNIFTTEMRNHKTNHFDDSFGDYANLGATKKTDIVSSNIRNGESDDYYDVSMVETIVVRFSERHCDCLFHCLYRSTSGDRGTRFIRTRESLNQSIKRSSNLVLTSLQQLTRVRKILIISYYFAYLRKVTREKSTSQLSSEN